jgi:hypothetical protein
MRAYIESCSGTIRPIPVGLAFADESSEIRADNALYYGCRSDASDTLENADYVGINAYLHCNGVSDALPGYENLLSDFTNYSLPMPAILSEFGCIDGSFPTIDGYAAQRTFLDVDALFSQRYRNALVGGIVFEYSTELIYSASPYPFVTFGTGNFGVGYFTPEDCDDITIPCVYIPYPQFEILASKYAAADFSDEPNIDDYVVADSTYPQCPPQIPALNTFTWPSASTEDMACPNFVYLECPNVPEDCWNLGIESIATSQPTAPTSMSPTNSPSTSAESISPTNAPSTFIVSPNVSTGKPGSRPSISNNIKPTIRPTGSPNNGSPPIATPNSRPSTAPTSSAVAVVGWKKVSVSLLLSMITSSFYFIMAR